MNSRGGGGDRNVVIRTYISITEEQHRVLAAVSDRTGKSFSSLVRHAVDTVYDADRSTDEDLVALDAGFAAWEDRAVDGAEWVDRLRSGGRPPDTREHPG